MHTYSTDGESRVQIAGWLGILSLGTVIGLERVVSEIPAYAPYGIDPVTPTVGVVLGLFFLAWSRVGWSISLVQRLGIVETPDLSGEWSGTLYSSYNDDLDSLAESDAGMAVTVHIQQSWRKILIEFTGPDSQSKSTSASFVTTGVDPEIRYQYRNRPDIESPDSMNPHLGNTVLSYLAQKDEADELVGWYYTGPERKSYGRVKLTRSVED